MALFSFEVFYGITAVIIGLPSRLNFSPAPFHVSASRWSETINFNLHPSRGDWFSHSSCLNHRALGSHKQPLHFHVLQLAMASPSVNDKEVTYSGNSVSTLDSSNRVRFNNFRLRGVVSALAKLQAHSENNRAKTP
eukprot:4760533-Amphidinium_carterae.1